MHCNILNVMYISYAGSNVIPVQRDGKYLFSAATHFMQITKDNHSELKLFLTKLSVSGREHYKYFIVDLSMVTN